MRLEVGKVPPVLISVHGRPLIELLVEERDLHFPDTPIHLVVNQGKEQIWEFLSRTPLKGVHTLEVPDLPDLGETIQYALTELSLDSSTQLTINFGDTVVNFKSAPTTDSIFYETCRESYLWTSFKQKRGRITEIVDRFGSESLAPNDVFTGVFTVSNPRELLKELKRSKADPVQKISKFYVALSNYLSQKSYRLVKAPRWLDFGHVENYHRARKHSSLARSFNSLVFDENRPTVTKTSSRSEKLRDEINWYLNLPRDFKCYAPQVISFDLNKPSVELEYYGYPTVAELFVTAGHGLEIWWPVIKSIESILGQMRRYSSPITSAKRRAILSEMYIEKTISRINDLDSHPVLGPLTNEPILVNGKKLPALKDFCSILPRLCKQGGVLESGNFTLIHGDFCFSNILFDTRMRLAKVIDPRGSFGTPGIFGDPRYDIAKILHSSDGNYDLVKSNQFFAIADGHSINYSIYTKPIHTTASKFFREILGNSFKEDLGPSTLIEALLFASLISLHNESLHHQIAFLGIALNKLAEQCKIHGISVPSRKSRLSDQITISRSNRADRSIPAAALQPRKPRHANR